MYPLRVISATGLNIRRLPSANAPVIVAMPRDMIVQQLDSNLRNERWLFIRASFPNNYTVEGYSLGSLLAPVAADGSDQIMPASIPHFSPTRRAPTLDRPLKPDLQILHAQFTPRLEDLIDRCNQTGLPFKIFEAFRTPDRQHYLFAKSKPGNVLTDADAWESHHNYGFAADIVLNLPKSMDPWETKKIGGVDYGRMWLRMRELAQKCGLHTLTKKGKPWDLPHVELPESSWRRFQQGQFPNGGGQSWARNLQFMSAAYPKNAPNLSALEPDLCQRHRIDMGVASSASADPSADSAADPAEVTRE